MVPVGTPRRVFVIALVLGGVGLAVFHLLAALATSLPALKEFRKA
jgi:hypothetical protein